MTDEPRDVQAWAGGVRRIHEEPDFLDREWRAVEAETAQGGSLRIPGMPDPPDPLPPAWLVGQWRQTSGGSNQRSDERQPS